MVDAGAKMLNEVAPYLQMRADKTFPNVESVIKTRARFVTLVDKLQQLQSNIVDVQIRQSISPHIDALSKTVDEINRGEKVGNLDWFYKNAPSSK